MKCSKTFPLCVFGIMAPTLSVVRADAGTRSTIVGQDLIRSEDYPGDDHHRFHFDPGRDGLGCDGRSKQFRVVQKKVLWSDDNGKTLPYKPFQGSFGEPSKTAFEFPCSISSARAIWAQRWPLVAARAGLRALRLPLPGVRTGRMGSSHSLPGPVHCLARGADRIFVTFNNHYKGQAITNARMTQRMLQF